MQLIIHFLEVVVLMGPFTEQREGNCTKNAKRLVAAGEAHQADIRAQTHHFPLKTPARVGFAQAHAVPKRYFRQHEPIISA